MDELEQPAFTVDHPDDVDADNDEEPTGEAPGDGEDDAPETNPAVDVPV